MPVILNLKSKKYSLEGKFELDFFRERLDIKDVLQKIKQGDNLFNLFPTSVAESIKKQFIEAGYIDANQKLQNNGEDFINNPFKIDKETSIYSAEIIQFNLSGLEKQMLINLTRRLTNEKLDSKTIALNDLVSLNELQINDEKIYFKSLKNLSTNKIYIKDEKNINVAFNLTDETYNANYGFKTTGHINEFLSTYVKKVLENKQTYFELDDKLQNIIIKSLKDFYTVDLLNGVISSIKIDDIEIINMPFIIDSNLVAIEYAYLYMYNKLVSGQYLSINEMNEAFENEILSKPIFTSEVKARLYDFKYTELGFSKYLDKKQFDEMSYKLRIMNTLLDIDIKDTKLYKVRNYNELANYITSLISPKDVEKLSLILGYAMAKTNKNKIIDCLEALNKYFEKIEIVVKNDGSNQKIDDSIKESILKHGVAIKANIEIGKNFHDRYIVFELRDGTYKCMLITNEIGQFFSLDTSEPLGSILPISNNEIVKSGKSLINMIKEAK